MTEAYIRWRLDGPRVDVVEGCLDLRTRSENISDGDIGS